MDEYQNRGFLLRQRAFLKLCLLGLIEERKEYGSQYLDQIRSKFKSYGYQPTHTELYKALHELTRDKVLIRTKKIKGDPKTDFQEVIYYQFTDDGYEKAQLYRKQMKTELDRCMGLLQKAVHDFY